MRYSETEMLMNHPSPQSMIEAVRELRESALHQEQALCNELAAVHEKHAPGGRNLAHYLAVRQHDLRELQRGLSALGLSSLGRMERCVLSTLQAVEHALRCLSGSQSVDYPAPPTDFYTGEAQLLRNTADLLGVAPQSGSAHVMVTLPVDSPSELIEQLFDSGANTLRINCSKGSPEEWALLIERVRATERRLGRSCRILCDLSGPNPRTRALGRGRSARKVLARVSPGDRFLLAKDGRTAALWTMC